MTKRQKGVLAASGIGLFLVFLDAMIANLALPKIQLEFGGGESTMQWIVVAYSVGMAVGIMPAGTIADRSGRKLVFFGSVILFSVASLVSGLAPELWVLILSRGVQGLAAAAISVTSLAIVSEEFSDPKTKAKAIGIWNAMAAVGLAVGPVLGGFLTEEVSWRAVFLIGVPVGAIVALLTVLFVGESKSKIKNSFDAVGQMLFALAIVSLSISVVMGPHEGWLSPLVASTFVLFIVALLAFAKYEREYKNPMMDLSLFKDKTYSWAISSVFALFFVVYGALLLATQYWQNIIGLSPIETGLFLLPFALVMIILPPRAGKLVAKVGPLKPAKIGLLLIFTGSLALIGAVYVSLLVSIAFMVLGIGVAFAGPSLTALSMSRVPKDRAGMASGIFSAQRAIGSTVGYAVMGSVLAAWLSVSLNANLAPVITNPESRAAVTQSVIDNANPHAYSAEIGPGEPIPIDSKKNEQDILNTAKKDFITGIQISVGVGAALILIMFVLGKYKYAIEK